MKKTIIIAILGFVFGCICCERITEYKNEIDDVEYVYPYCYE